MSIMDLFEKKLSDVFNSIRTDEIERIQNLTYEELSGVIITRYGEIRAKYGIEDCNILWDKKNVDLEMVVLSLDDMPNGYHLEPGGKDNFAPMVTYKYKIQGNSSLLRYYSHSKPYHMGIIKADEIHFQIQSFHKTKNLPENEKEKIRSERDRMISETKNNLKALKEATNSFFDKFAEWRRNEYDKELLRRDKLNDLKNDLLK